MGRFRFWLRTLGIVGGLLVCVPLHYLWTPFGVSPWPRVFLRWVGWTAGVRIRTFGTPLKRNVLFLSNHTSWLDIMILAGTTGTAFVSKEEVASWPVAGWLARLNRTVFIARAQRSAVKGQADALRDALASGRPVALFPEGTTEGGHDVLPFRARLSHPGFFGFVPSSGTWPGALGDLIASALATPWPSR